MNKSLTPLIVLFALIILATIIIINTQSKVDVIDYDQGKLLPAMELSPFRPIRQHRRPPKRTTRNHLEKTHVEMDAEKIINEARAFLVEGRMDLAEDKLRTLLVFEPDNLPALSLLGGIFYSSGRYAEAETIFDRQVALRPTDLAPRANLFKSLKNQEKFPAAMKVAEKALQIQPGSSSFMLNMARVYAVTGDENEAMSYLGKAFEKMGDGFLAVSFDHDFDSLRDKPEFEALIVKAERLNQERRRREALIKSIPEDDQVDTAVPSTGVAP